MYEFLELEDFDDRVYVNIVDKGMDKLVRFEFSEHLSLPLETRKLVAKANKKAVSLPPFAYTYSIQSILGWRF